MNHIFLFLILGYVQLLLQSAIVLNIANVRWTVNRLILTVAIIHVPHAIVFYNNFTLASVGTWLLLTFFAYRLSFKQSWWKSVFMAVAGQYLLSAGIDYINLFIINHLPDQVRFYMLENLFAPRIATAIVCILIFACTRKLAGREYSSFDYLVSKHRVFYLVFFLFFAVYDACHLTEIQYIGNSLTELFAIVLLISFFLLSVWYVRTDQKLAYTQRKLEIEEFYVDSQERTLNSLRGAKQELSALIDTMRELLQNGEHEKVDSIMSDIAVQRPQAISLPKSVKHVPMLIGTLLEKVIRAEMQGIQFEIEIMGEPIDLKYCSSLDYCRMMSTLLDAALEAAAESEKKIIKLLISVKNGKLESTVMNSCADDAEITRMLDRGHSIISPTSGEGIYLLHQYQSKYETIGYPMEVYTALENGYFSITFAI